MRVLVRLCTWNRYRRVVPGYFFEHTRIECDIPTCDDTPSGSTSDASGGCLGTLRLRVSHGGDVKTEWSSDSLPFTYYRRVDPPLLSVIEPEVIAGIGSYADLRRPHIITLHGSNFAPTDIGYTRGVGRLGTAALWHDGFTRGAGRSTSLPMDTAVPDAGLDELFCRFGGVGGATTRATFVHAHLIRCSTPQLDSNTTSTEGASTDAVGIIGASNMSDTSGTGDASAFVLSIGTTGVSVSNHYDDSAAGGWADPEMNITFFDGDAYPNVGRFTPIAFRDPSTHNEITIDVTNIAPLSSEELRCTFLASSVPAQWISDSRLVCMLPPSPLGSFDAVGVLSHGRVGNSTIRLTVYDEAGVPVVHQIKPPCAIRPPSTLLPLHYPVP